MDTDKIRRILKWSEGKSPGPYKIELNITDKCNLRCKFCWQRFFPVKDRALSIQEIKELVREAKSLGVKEIIIPGSGEPLTHPDIFEVMSFIKEQGMKGTLISNGTLFTEALVKGMVDLGWDYLAISIDDPTPSINDYLRGQDGAFSSALNTLNTFRRFKDAEKVPLIQINTLITSRNFDSLPEMVRLAKVHGAVKVMFQQLSVWGESINYLAPTPAQIKRFARMRDKVEKESLELGIDFSIPALDSNGGRDRREDMGALIKEEISGFDGFAGSVCYEPFYSLTINPDGRVGCCPISGALDISILHRSLKDIWYGKELSKIRESLLKKRLMPFCKNCCFPIFNETRKLRSNIKALEER